MRARAGGVLLVLAVASPAVVLAAIATLSATPGSLAFAERCVGSRAQTKAVVVRNDGDTAATSVSASISPAAAASEFPLTLPSIPDSLDPGEQLTMRVGFVPAKGGDRSASLVVAYSAQPSPVPSPSGTASPSPSPAPSARRTAIGISGSGLERFADVSPPSLDFGDVQVAGSASARTVTVFSDGATPLGLEGVSISGSGAAEFSVAPAGSATVTESSPRKLTIRFAPRGPGPRAATLVVATNACDRPTISIPLSGRGLAGDLLVTPTRMEFRDAAVGVPTPARVVRVANEGDAPVVIRAIEVEDEPDAFTMTGIPTLPLTLDPGDSFSFSVRFAPTKPGSVTTSIAISTDIRSSPIVRMPLSGEAGAPGPTASPTPDASPPPGGDGEGDGEPRGSRRGIAQYTSEIVVVAAVVAIFAILQRLRRRRAWL